jgi:hypothetical protein
LPTGRAIRLRRRPCCQTEASLPIKTYGRLAGIYNLDLRGACNCSLEHDAGQA